MKSYLFIFLSLSLLVLSGCKLLNNTPDTDVRYKKYPQPAHTGIFTAQEKNLIKSYYQQDGRNKPKKAKKLPKGLQKKYERTGQLPPGWEMKLARGEVLPSDIYIHARPLPPELIRRLPIGPVGSKILEIEGKIIRVIHHSRQILDILDL